MEREGAIFDVAFFPTSPLPLLWLVGWLVCLSVCLFVWFGLGFFGRGMVVCLFVFAFFVVVFFFFFLLVCLFVFCQLTDCAERKKVCR